MKTSFKKYEELKREHEYAMDYVSRVGEPQYHYRDNSVGRLFKCTVSTQVSHQRQTGAENYHSNQEFDEALSEVISQSFPELAQKALFLMEHKAYESLAGEEDYLKDRLQQVEVALKALNAFDKAIELAKGKE